MARQVQARRKSASPDNSGKNRPQLDFSPETLRELESLRNNEDAGKKRVQLDLAPQTLRELDALKTLMGLASRADVVRFSLELLKFGYKAKKDGKRLGVKNADGTIDCPLIPGVDGL